MQEFQSIMRSSSGEQAELTCKEASDSPTTIKRNVMCLVLYRTYVAGILIKVEEINFYILLNNKLKYLDYIEKCISGKQCTVFHRTMMNTTSNCHLVKNQLI